MTPDIVVNTNTPPSRAHTHVIELEANVNFDFGASLRQIKKYKNITDNILVIIPRIYERFAPLYMNEGFRVWLWEATRVWECMECGTITKEKKILKSKCSSQTCNSNQQRLKGLDNIIFEAFSSS